MLTAAVRTLTGILPTRATMSEHPCALTGRLLLVDPDWRARRWATNELAQAGHRVLETDDAEAIEQAGAQGHDLLLIDPRARPRQRRGWPSDAWDCLLALRRQHLRLPVIVLLQSSDATDRCVALELGADAVLSKPLDGPELRVRVRALLRRRALDASAAPASWRVDPQRRDALSPDGRRVALSPAEARLLQVFLDRPSHTFTRHDLLDLARGQDVQQLDRSIDGLIARLRHKLGANGPIRTVRGVGYLFEAMDATELGPDAEICQPGNAIGTQA
jgi:two-component system, OmpR family, response regulator